jgi:MerR family mercuric resistance operon transcriptional regulator
MTLTISRLAASADVHVETVRYYQRRGLLPEPPRPQGGVRHYGPADVARLQFIRRGQTMGFTLNEIAGLLELKGKRACEKTRQMTEHKLADVRLRLAELRQLERDLVALVAECSRASADADCPTLSLLEQADASGGKKQASAHKQRPRATSTNAARGPNLRAWGRKKKTRQLND